ncbi:hypothetical protein M878_00120 [Streptomyces roseochromogenus subsp. oscitans DS 12.976]|uniref:Uncharacterized protein n=1 Tax=Streptomyces roseochromogenus subsp. oscitans DS 12.976 TaxID=1352936 RepID=V6KXH9_STRRC|nr:hypothetical protein M878_00120 [Streptomyces roseochromogenus subsp. oscitans DS 12.976]
MAYTHCIDDNGQLNGQTTAHIDGDVSGLKTASIDTLTIDQPHLESSSPDNTQKVFKGTIHLETCAVAMPWWCYTYRFDTTTAYNTTDGQPAYTVWSIGDPPDGDYAINPTGQE